MEHLFEIGKNYRNRIIRDYDRIMKNRIHSRFYVSKHKPGKRTLNLRPAYSKRFFRLKRACREISHEISIFYKEVCRFYDRVLRRITW